MTISEESYGVQGVANVQEQFLLFPIVFFEQPLISKSLVCKYHALHVPDVMKG